MTCLGDAPETLGRPRAATLRSGAMKDDQVRRVHERLAAAPGLRPVSFGEGRRFGLWDLASLTGGTLGACVDPDSLTVSIEKRLRAGAGGDDRRRYLHRYEIRESEGELAFVASPGNDSDSDLVPLLAAGDIDGRLVLRETEQYRRLPDRLDTVRRYARSTLALHLAVRGRPLVRGEEERDRAHRSCDIGEPEGLAYKIRGFERVAREEGWRVEPPLPECGASPAVIRMHGPSST